MKSVEKHIGKLFVSIAILLVFGNVSFAKESFVAKEKASVVAELQNDGQGKPFVFDRVSVGEVSQTISHNEYLGFGLFGAFSTGQDFPHTHDASFYNASYFLKDKRELIFRHLFPFHFFW